MKSRLLLDIVIREGPAVFELLASEDEALLVRRNALLVLDLALDVIDSVAGLDFEGDWREMSAQKPGTAQMRLRTCLASQGLYEDLHSSAQPEHQVEGRLLLDVVIRQRAAVLELLARKDEALLVRGNSVQAQGK